MRWDLRDVKVGDELTVEPGCNHGLLAFVTVSKVGTNFVVDSTGKKWSRSGIEWGGGDRWNGPTCRPRDAADDERQEGRRLVKQSFELRHVRWNKLPPETIRAVHALVFPKAEAVGGGA